MNKLFLKSAFIVLVITFIYGCMMTPSPKPGEATYGRDFSQSNHIEDLLNEGRYNDAFLVYLSLENPDDIERNALLKLAEKLMVLEQPAFLVFLEELAITPVALVSREEWVEEGRRLARAQRLVTTFSEVKETAPLPHVQLLIERQRERHLHWMRARADKLSDCLVQDLTQCAKQYPIMTSLKDLSDREKHELGLFMINKMVSGMDPKEGFRKSILIADRLHGELGFSRGSRGLVNVFLVAASPLSQARPSQVVSVGRLSAVSATRAAATENRSADSEGGRFELFLGLFSDEVRPIHRGSSTVASEYRVSERIVPNPEYQALTFQIGNLRAQIQQAQNTVSASSSTSPVDSFMRGHAQGQIMTLSRQVSQLGARLSRMSPQITVPVYQTYEYEVRRLSLIRETSVGVVVFDEHSGHVSKYVIRNEVEKSFEAAVGKSEFDKNNRHRKIDISAEIGGLEAAPLELDANQLLSSMVAFVDGAGRTPSQHVSALSPVKSIASNPRSISRVGPSETVYPGAIEAVVVVQDGLGGMGAGFYIRDRLVVSNYHVVKDVGIVEVTGVDGISQFGRVVHKDVDADVALIRVDRPGKVLGFHQGVVPIGATVFAVGHPQGLRFSVSKGSVSAVREIQTLIGTTVRAVQTDTAINPGNSGGPLLLEGKVVGVNTFRLGGSAGLGFAVHHDRVREVLEEYERQL